MQDNRELFEHQLAGVEFLSARARAGLHDDPGGGKTQTAISTVDKLKLRRGVVITRALLCKTWQREFIKYGTIKRRIVIGKSIHDFEAWKQSRYDVLILSFERALRFKIQMLELMQIYDFLHIDEAHFLTNPQAQRTAAVLGPRCDGMLGAAMWARYAYHITGTPWTRDGLHLWPFLRFVRAYDGELHDFQNDFFEVCHTQHGSKLFARDDALPQLRALVEANAIRHDESVWRGARDRMAISQLYMDGDTSQVAKFFAEHPGLDERISAALDRGGINLIQESHIMTIRRLIGEAKAVPFAHYLAEMIRDDQLKKVVVLGWHIQALETVKAVLDKWKIKNLLVHGTASTKVKETAEVQFQTDPDTRVFIGNILTAGTGITLTAAYQIYMLESAWKPLDNWQALLRVDRIGQRVATQGIFVTLADSYDEVVQQIVTGHVQELSRIYGRQVLGSPKVDQATLPTRLVLPSIYA